MIMPRGEQLLLPASPAFIWGSLLVALMLNLLPLGRVLWMPDFLAVVLVFWNVHQSRRVGIGAAFLFGLAMDVHDGAVLGQHALAYTLLAFGGVALHRRLQMFELRQQTTQVLGIFAVTYGVYALVHWQVNGYVVWPYLLGCLTSTLMWAPLSIMFRAMRQARVERE